MNTASDSPWYAGQFVRRHGPHGAIDVLALKTSDGWVPITDARKLFPRAGQVAMKGVGVSTLRAGDWLAFRLAGKRHGEQSFTIGEYRMMARYVDMATLGSSEAARVLFSTEGYALGRQAGHWAVRFSDDRIVVLDLSRHGDTLRATGPALKRVPCYDFDAACLVSEPFAADTAKLYDLRDAVPLKTHDWSADADYIAHVVHSLADADDPRLEELITWLELHRDAETGRVSAIGADHDRAFEALRSGELAARLSADRKVMAAYLAAVRDDPAIAQVVSDAASRIATRDRETVVATLRSELSAEHERKLARQDEELRDRERALSLALEERVKSEGAALESQLKERIEAAEREAALQAAARNEVLEAETAAIRSHRDQVSAERDRLSSETARLTEELKTLEESRFRAEEEVSRLTAAVSALKVNAEPPSRTLASLPDKPRGKLLAVEQLAIEISRMALLTSVGKMQMERFATFLLAGELPVLEGSQADDFALVAEAMIAAGGLVPFEVDATILTPEDIWSRPGSGVISPVAAAASRALEGNCTFLVQLRGIERSAARAWYPALAALVRRGLLARRLLIFATIIDAASDEAQALPYDICRMRIEESIVPSAARVAPSVLGSGPASIAFHLDPGPRPEDLSAGLTALVDLESEVDVAMSLRIARVAVEASRLRPGNSTAGRHAARDFYADMGVRRRKS